MLYGTAKDIIHWFFFTFNHSFILSLITHSFTTIWASLPYLCHSFIFFFIFAFSLPSLSSFFRYSNIHPLFIIPFPFFPSSLHSFPCLSLSPSFFSVFISCLPFIFFFVCLLSYPSPINFFPVFLPSFLPFLCSAFRSCFFFPSFLPYFVSLFQSFSSAICPALFSLLSVIPSFIHLLIHSTIIASTFITRSFPQTPTHHPSSSLSPT